VVKNMKNNDTTKSNNTDSGTQGESQGGNDSQGGAKGGSMDTGSKYSNDTIKK